MRRALSVALPGQAMRGAGRQVALRGVLRGATPGAPPDAIRAATNEVLHADHLAVLHRATGSAASGRTGRARTGAATSENEFLTGVLSVQLHPPSRPKLRAG